MAPLHHAPLRISKAKWSGGREPSRFSDGLAKGELHLQRVAATNGMNCDWFRNWVWATVVAMHLLWITTFRSNGNALPFRIWRIARPSFGLDPKKIHCKLSRHPATFRACLASSSALHRLFISKAYEALGCNRFEQ
jgi:hypothetical protein